MTKLGNRMLTQALMFEMYYLFSYHLFFAFFWFWFISWSQQIFSAAVCLLWLSYICKERGLSLIFCEH